MLIGNKEEIAFEFIRIEEEHAIIKIYLENIDITPFDNSHYYPIIVTGLKRDIEQLRTLDLTLKDQYKILDLPDLYEILEDGSSIYYANMHLDCFYYDLSTIQGHFYFYQHIDDLIFFGKLHDSYDLRFCKIRKSKYLALLQELLEVLTNANPNHYVHKLKRV